MAEHVRPSTMLIHRIATWMGCDHREILQRSPHPHGELKSILVHEIKDDNVSRPVGVRSMTQQTAKKAVKVIDQEDWPVVMSR